MFNSDGYLAIAAARGLAPLAEPEPQEGDMPTRAELERADRNQERRMRHPARFGRGAAA